MICKKCGVNIRDISGHIRRGRCEAQHIRHKGQIQDKGKRHFGKPIEDRK